MDGGELQSVGKQGLSVCFIGKINVLLLLQ
jgi:hypothetical protein